MINRFVGTGRKEWEESVREARRNDGYVSDFIVTEYFIKTINGCIKVLNPYNFIDDKDSNHLRIVINFNEIIDIPYKNILYIQTNYREHIDMDKVD